LEEMPAMVFLEHLENPPRFPLLKLLAELRTSIFKHIFTNCIIFTRDKIGAVSKTAVFRNTAKLKIS
jgi:hypothetical protein